MCGAKDLEAWGTEAECYKPKSKGQLGEELPLFVHRWDGALRVPV